MRFQFFDKEQRGNLILLLCLILPTAATANAQPKQRTKVAAKDFAVPCRDVLSRDLETIVELHQKDFDRRRAKNRIQDSGDETAVREAAYADVIRCRRKRTASIVKKLPADLQKSFAGETARAKDLARARFENLIYGVSWDETSDEPINRLMTQNAVALIEDYRVRLADLYADDRALFPGEAARVAAENIKEIRRLLEKIKRDAARTEIENADQSLAILKQKISEFYSPEEAPNDLRVRTDFVVALLKLGLADDENQTLNEEN